MFRLFLSLRFCWIVLSSWQLLTSFFFFQNSASQLDKLINRWAADVIRAPPAPLPQICAALMSDIAGVLNVTAVEATPMQVQSYLRHAMAETISEGVINCLIVTNSTEANIQLTRIHEHIFARKLDLIQVYFISPDPVYQVIPQWPAFGGGRRSQRR